jgi:hypothetical protein
MHWTLGTAAPRRAAFSSIFLDLSFSVPEQNPRSPQRRSHQPLARVEADYLASSVMDREKN